MSRALRRRDLLKASLLAVAGLSAIKVVGRVVIGVEPPTPAADPARLRHLSPRQAATVTAAALAMLGEAGEAAFAAQTWDPAAGVDDLLEQMAPDQRALIGVVITLLEEWTLGLRGFSRRSREQQRAILADWRDSGLAVHRSGWGVLHVTCAVSFTGIEAGWAVMDYPGPCVGTGRMPGQTALFDWDESVP